MSAKRESIKPMRSAMHKIVPADICELHWPHHNGVELVQVLLVEKRHATVERLDFHTHDDARTRVRREWLKPYKVDVKP